MKKQLLSAILIALTFSWFHGNSQQIEDVSKIKFGLGAGLNYGGLGFRFSYIPVRYIAVYCATGYNFLDVSYNVGGTIRFKPDKRFCPTIGAMYGYNAVIKIIGNDDLSKTYYGPSFSLGFELKSKKRPENFLNIELIIPIRSKDYKDNLDFIKNHESIELKSFPTPVMISVGYHFGF